MTRGSINNAERVNKRNLKGFFSSAIFFTIFGYFSIFRPKSEKMDKNGQKMVGEKNPFQFLILTHFAPYMPKIKGLGSET